MPRANLKRLIRVLKKEKPGKSKYRLHAARLRKEGRGIRRYRGCWRCPIPRPGLAGPHARRQPGREVRPQGKGQGQDIAQEDPQEDQAVAGPRPVPLQVRGRILADGHDTGHVAQELGIRCKTGTLRRALRRIRFSYRKSRPVPYNAARPEEQERFKNGYQPGGRQGRPGGFTVLSCDEMHPRLWPGAGYGWRPTNGRDTVKTTYSKKSVSIYGVLGSGRVPHPDRTGMQLRDVQGVPAGDAPYLPQDLLILDNAPYHKSGTVTDFVEDNKDRLRLVFLPAHTPQLNPIEQQWNVLKRLLAAGTSRRSRSSGWPSRPSPATAGCAPVRMMSYLAVAQQPG